MTVADIEAAFADGTATSESLTQAFQARIATYNPDYNAIVFANPSALDDARASDASTPAPNPGAAALQRPSAIPPLVLEHSGGR